MESLDGLCHIRQAIDLIEVIGMVNGEVITVMLVRMRMVTVMMMRMVLRMSMVVWEKAVV